MTAGGRVPRVALFTDSYREANGVATLSRALEANARERGLPYLCVHGGAATRLVSQDSVQRLELRRSAVAFHLEHDLTFDPLLWRHYWMAERILTEFRPDVVHVTGPSDIGQLGALLGHRLSIPIVGSWHTNLHQYAAHRSARWCAWLPSGPRISLLSAIERHALTAALLFYKIPRVVMAPNEELVELLTRRTGKAAHLMRHGVDTQTFAPEKRDRRDTKLRIGYVGRLSAEKGVRVLARLEHAFSTATGPACEFVIIGDGAEREWLQQEMPAAQFCGVLQGDDLARAYANFDLFVFPSKSETFGLAVLEAMASGVPVLAMAHGGPRFVLRHGVSGWLAGDDDELVEAGLMLACDRALRCRMGTAARACALTRSWETVCDRLYEVYGETM